MENLIVKEMGSLAEKAYDTLPKDLIFTLDKKTYTVIDSIDKSSGLQGYLLQNDSTVTDEPKYVFAFRGTEVKSFSDLFTLEGIKDLFITDIAYMGSGTAPQQMKDAMAFIKKI